MAKKEESKKVVKKDTKKKETKKQPKEKFLVAIKKELKLVKWPTFKEIVKYTVSTIIFCMVLIAFFMLVTFIMAEVTGVIKG